MTQVSRSPGGLGEEELAAQAALARGLVVSRLEMLWRACQPHVSGEAGKPDPRFVEAGIRVLDRLMRVFRLDAPAQQGQEQLTPLDAAAMVEGKLAELESRLQGP